MNADLEDQDMLEVISRSPWFEGLPIGAHQRLADAARIHAYPKNSYLYTTGETGSDVYCILSGRVRLLLTSAIGQEYAVRDLDPEAWLGEQFLDGDQPTALDAQINEPTTVLVIPRSAVLEVGEQHPQMYRKLFRATLARSRGLFTLLQGMAFYPLRSRLAAWLVNLTEEHGQKTADGVYLDVNLSQNDLAQLSLGSRQRINKILGEWREQGIIELQSNRYLIRDTNALSREIELKDTDD